MVTIKNVYLYFSKEKFHTTEYFKLRLSNNGEITKLYYGDPESSKELVKKNDKEFFRREIYRNRETIIKKYLSEDYALIIGKAWTASIAYCMVATLDSYCA